MNKIKKKKLITDNSSFFNKLKSELLEENKKMRKNIKSSYSTLKKRQNVFNLTKTKINTPKEFSKLFYSYNKGMSRKNRRYPKNRKVCGMKKRKTMLNCHLQSRS